ISPDHGTLIQNSAGTNLQWKLPGTVDRFTQRIWSAANRDYVVPLQLEDGTQSLVVCAPDGSIRFPWDFGGPRDGYFQFQHLADGGDVWIYRRGKNDMTMMGIDASGKFSPVAHLSVGSGSLLALHLTENHFWAKSAGNF